MFAGFCNNEVGLNKSAVIVLPSDAELPEEGIFKNDKPPASLPNKIIGTVIK